MKRSELFFTFILLPIDIAMFILSFVLSFSLRSHLESPFSTDFGLKTYLLYSVLLVPVMALIFGLNGLYSRRNYMGYWQEFYKVAISISATIFVLIVAIFLSKSLFFSRLILIFTWILALLLISAGRVLLRSLERFFLRFGVGVRNVILVGAGDISEKIVSEIQKRPDSAYKVLGMVMTGDRKSDLKILGDIDNISVILKKFKVDEVVLTDSLVSRNKILDLIHACEDNKIYFKYVPDIFGMMTSSFKAGLIGSTPVMEYERIPLDGWGRITKRIADMLLAAILLLILSPLMLIIAVLVKLTSKGPVFYWHERIGRDEKKFKFFKFRSMYLDKCDFEGGEKWTTKEDEKTRITPIGLFIRKTNLDELPQIWNILKGDMSFVGPRPEQPKLVEKFEKQIPEYFRRHKVKSGLTGWAQVNGLKGDTSVKERVQYDLYYIENWSLWFDFKILLKTIGLIIYEAFRGKYEYRSRS